MADTGIWGYKLDATNLEKVNDVIKKIKNAFEKKFKEQYCSLLQEQIEDLVDNLATNAVHLNDPNMSIWQCAVNDLNHMIAHATQNRFSTRYCFYVAIAVYNDKDCKNTYIRLEEPTGLYKDTLEEIEELENYNVSKLDMELGMPKSVEWFRVLKEYDANGLSPLAMTLFNGYTADEVYFADLSFKDKKERVSIRANYQYLSRMINQYNYQNNPVEAMRFIDMAMQSKDPYHEIAEYERQLDTILPEITEALVLNS